MIDDNDMSFNDALRYAQAICEGCSSKRKVGKILSAFTTNRYSDAEKVSFIHDIITLDFFMDISGTMDSFFAQLRGIKNEIVALLEAEKRLSKEGELVDSDADEDGNLR